MRTPVGGADRRRTSDPWRAVLVAVLVAGAGAAAYFGAITTTGFPTDEDAHTAYARVIGEGTLPDVNTLRPGIEAPTDPDRRLPPNRYIYVANHPPLFPAVQAGIAKALDATGLATDAERPVGRALNAMCTLGAAVALAALGRELTGQRAIGVLAAGLFVATPGLWTLASYGYSDGGAVLATVLAAWAGVRAWKRADIRSLWWLGLAVALAGGMRAMALIPAVLVAAVAGVRAAWPAGGFEPSGAGGGARAVRVLRSGLIVSVPAVVTASWWYIRNWTRFGDPVASAELIQYLNRDKPRGGVPGRFGDLAMWQSMLHDVVVAAYSSTYFLAQPHLPSWVAWCLGLGALAGIVALLVPTRLLGRGTPPIPTGWPVLAVAVLGVALGIALHTANGGTPHPRYLLPALPLLAFAVTLGLARLHRLAPVAAMAGAAAASVALAVDATRFMDQFVRMSGQAPLGGDGLAQVAAVVVAAGLGAVAWTTYRALARR